MRVHFHGAAGEVTGSLHEVEAAGRRLLLDCGMIQGSQEAERRNTEAFTFDPATLDALAPIRLRVLRSPKTDVDLFHLVEELCRRVDAAFGANEAVTKSSAAETVRGRATVISLDRFRARRLRSLA